MKNSIWFCCILLCFDACKKEDKITSGTDKSTSEYLPMKVGSYWIYQEYEADTLGVLSLTEYYDSITIQKDTLINSNQYFKFVNYQFTTNTAKSNNIIFRYYRDSCKNLIDVSGKIVFSESNFKDTILKYGFKEMNDTLYWLSGKMEHMKNIVNVPAGNFDNVLNLKNTIICNPLKTLVRKPLYSYNLYAKDVGKILYTKFWISSGIKMEFRLARYSILK